MYFDINTLQQMANAGQLFTSSLVWKTGMAAWVSADSVDEPKGLFENAMSPIPPTGE